MDLEKMPDILYETDTKAAYEGLKDLERISDTADILYSYVDQFLDMLGSDRYVVRVRGYRLLCRQAKWDDQGRIDQAIDKILEEIDDEKPTAVRQKLSALGKLAEHKKQLHGRIRERLLGMDCEKYRETMRGLIEKDVKKLLAALECEES